VGLVVMAIPENNIMRKSAIVLIFTALGLSSFAQKQKKINTKEVIIVTGKVLTPEDSSLVKDVFLSGLREKISAHYNLAEEYFQRVLKLDPSNDAAMFELSQLALNNNQVDVAEDYIKLAVTVMPDNQWYWLLMANVYQLEKKYDLLIYALDELIRLQPDKTDYRLNKANALFLLDKPKEAMLIYNSIEQITGLTDDLLAAKQRVYLKTGEIDKAAKDLEGLIALQPDHLKYYLLLGQLYDANDMPDKAIEVLQNALKMEADNYDVRLLLGNIYQGIKKDDLAFSQIKIAFAQKEMPIDQKVAMVIAYFNKFPDSIAVERATELSKLVTEVHSNDPKSFSLYGDVLYQGNKMSDAEKAYERALELNNNVYAIWDQLIRIKLSLNNFSGAIESAQTALELFPKQSELYYYLGVGYRQNKKPQKAIENLKQAITYNISDQTNLKSQIYSSLGDVYQDLKQYKESAQAYDESLKLLPDNAYTLNNYAYYLSLRNQNLDLAEKMAKKANDLERDNSSFEDTYAWVLFKSKKFIEAKKWMEQALQHNSNNSGNAFEHYGDILYKLGNTNEALNNWQKAWDLGEKSLILKRKINEKKYLD
jgi:tetratricopeptide (TPR) repeat protein